MSIAQHAAVKRSVKDEIKRPELKEAAERLPNRPEDNHLMARGGHFLQKLNIPGYHLHVCTLNDPDDPFKFAEMTHPSQGWSVAAPHDVGLADSNGNYLFGGGDRVVINMHGGIQGVLLKQPNQYYEEDLEKEAMSARSVHHDPVKNLEGDIRGQKNIVKKTFD